MIRYQARWVLPISAPPIENGTVAVSGERITYVGPRHGAPAGGRELDLGNALLLPGLVNAHTHLELTAMRGFLEDLEFHEWIIRLNRAKRAVLDRDSMLDAARLGIVEGLRAGITTYADTCDSGVAFEAMLEAGVRGIMYQEVFGPAPEQSAAALADLIAKVDALRERTTALVRVGVSPHAPYTVSDTLYRAVAGYAGENDLPVAVHIAESEAERELVEKGTGSFAEGLRKRGIEIASRARSSVALLGQTGVLRARPLLIHCVRVDSADIESIALSGSSVAHCPVSNAKLGHGTCPVPELIGSGVVVGLGSDSVASNNRMDMLAEARAAILAQRGLSGRHNVMTAHQALRLATIDGARALGIDTVTGSLEPGKQADIAAFPLDECSSPVHDPEAAAIFSLHGVPALLVTVAGRELVRDGRALFADPKLMHRVEATACRMREWSDNDRSKDRS